MGCAARELREQRAAHRIRVEKTQPEQEYEIHRIFDAGVRPLAVRKRVSVDLLGELLLTGERHSVCGRDTGETEEVLSGEPVGRRRDDLPTPASR